MKKVIATDQAPSAIGAYSQAVRVGNTVYVSGQIPLDAQTMQVCPGGFAERVDQVIGNLAAVAQASGGGLEHVVKLNVYLTDLSKFSQVNERMEALWPQPYPARACVEVSALPRGVDVEMDAILVL